jgi:xanthine dehydrogenase YagR molybdenum-binding subunit
MSVIGKPLVRVDGRMKVTGSARFAAEFDMPRLAYVYIVQSTIPSGRITVIDDVQASQSAGVLAVVSHRNAPKLPGAETRLSLLQDDRISYNGQPIALVIAETLEQAKHAASLIRVQCSRERAALDFEAGFASARPSTHNNEPGDVSWGDVDGALQNANIKIDQVYTTPIQHHNPMEPHAATAEWQGNRLTIHESTQDISGHRSKLAKIFGIPEYNVQVICPFVGGGFGCKGPTWSHVVLAAMAAKLVNRPVRLALERPQMFGPVGARPQTHQRLTLGATPEGKLTAIRHEVHAHTSFLEDYLESSAFPTRVVYDCPNVATIHRIVQLNLGTPTYTRAPGVATGTYALEVAMDELAYQVKMDPLELRLLNYTEVDPHTRLPFTEKHLRECYTQGATRFGWRKRNHEPRSMRDGAMKIGWGVATETYPANRRPASALVQLKPDGRVLVASGTHEIGNGMYTIMAQVTADVLNIAPHLIDVQLGDTTLPQAPISAGSLSAASVTPAVQAAAEKAKSKLVAAAVADPSSPVHGAQVGQVDFKDGLIFLKSSPKNSESFVNVLRRNHDAPIESVSHVEPDANLKQKYSSHSFGAVFAEVGADLDLGIVRVRRIVAVYDVGRLLNEKTAKSQFIGGIVWGVSLALHEDTQVDPRNGRIVNGNLADYHVPVNADIGEITVSAIDIPDTKLDPLGVRGIGEIGITGTAAAIANAVFHATGKRIRNLPITPEKLLV